MKFVKFSQGQFLTIRAAKTTKPVVIVSKKISTKAVVRNRLRRQIKEILRQYKTKSIIVKVLKLPAAKDSFNNFNKEITQCLANLLSR